MRNLKAKIALILLQILICQPAFAAKVTYGVDRAGQVQLYYRGEIENGDYERVLAAIGETGKFSLAESISLDSPGGSVSEALKIAQVIESSGLIARI